MTWPTNLIDHSSSWFRRAVQGQGCIFQTTYQIFRNRSSIDATVNSSKSNWTFRNTNRLVGSSRFSLHSCWKPSLASSSSISASHPGKNVRVYPVGVNLKLVYLPPPKNVNRRRRLLTLPTRPVPSHFLSLELSPFWTSATLPLLFGVLKSRIGRFVPSDLKTKNNRFLKPLLPSVTSSRVTQKRVVLVPPPSRCGGGWTSAPVSV